MRQQSVRASDVEEKFVLRDASVAHPTAETILPMSAAALSPKKAALNWPAHLDRAKLSGRAFDIVGWTRGVAGLGEDLVGLVT